MQKVHLKHGCSTNHSNLGLMTVKTAAELMEHKPEHQCKKCLKIAKLRTESINRHNLRNFAALMNEFAQNIEPA